ncbi:MAG: DUF547 domain-containing protein [Acidobacteriota bacterium]
MCARTGLARLLSLIFIILVAALPVQAGSEKFDHSLFDHVLRQFVDARGYVNYTALKAQRGELDAYIEMLARTSPTNVPTLFPDRAARLAYWINAYNAFVLRGVIDNYPTDSVRDIYALYGFFWRLKFVTGGEKISLRKLENEIIRKQFSEPRIHFAIVCASEGCPRLANEAYFPERLEEQLQAQAHKFINEERNVRIDEQQNRLYLSKIFDWFENDFLHVLPGKERERKITDYLKRYLSPTRQQALARLSTLRIEYIDYDWRINDQARKDVVAASR